MDGFAQRRKAAAQNATINRELAIVRAFRLGTMRDPAKEFRIPYLQIRGLCS